MDKLILGMIVGRCLMQCCFLPQGDKEAVKVGWIKIDGEIYTLRKADVVDATEEVK